MRQRLGQASVPPPTYVWSNVERALQRRRRRFFFWLFAIGIASASIWSLWHRQDRVPIAVADSPQVSVSESATQAPVATAESRTPSELNEHAEAQPESTSSSVATSAKKAARPVPVALPQLMSPKTATDQPDQPAGAPAVAQTEKGAETTDTRLSD